MIDKRIQKIIKNYNNINDRQFNFVLQNAIDINQNYKESEILMWLSVLLFKLGEDFNKYIK